METTTTPARIVVTRRIPAPADVLLAGHHAVEYLEDTGRSVADAVADGTPMVIVSQLTDPIDADLLQAGQVVAVSNYAAGVDNIDLDAARRFGVRVGHTPDVLTAPTADIALLLMLAVSRRLLEGEAMMRSNDFTGWRPDLLLGRSLSGARLGLVGSGKIAQAVARRAAAFDMEVVFARLRNAFSSPNPMSSAVAEVSFDDLLATSDFISIHVPLAPATHHLFDAVTIGRMKRTAFLINTARGSIVDERALVGALRGGVIAGAGLDVFEEEPHTAPGLVDLPNVVLLPHLGSATAQTRSAMADICVRNAIAFATQQTAPAELPLHG